MKLLFDQNSSHRLINRLQDILSHSHQVRELNLENATDKEIWEYAKENGFTIVTFDANFYDFSIVWGHPPRIIWIRTLQQTTNKVEEIIRKHLITIKEFEQDDKLACLEIINH